MKPISELYKDLDENALGYKYSGSQFELYSLSRIFREFLQNEENEENEVEYASWEQLFFGLGIYYNEFFSTGTTINQEGKEYLTYDPKKIEIKQRKYLENRLLNSKNALLKSRYSHILYLIYEEKELKEKYGKLAIDNYLAILDLLKTEKAIDKGKQREIEILTKSIIINLTLLACELKFRKVEVREIFLRILIDDVCQYPLRLIGLMTAPINLFEKSDYVGIQKKCIEIGMKLLKENDPYDAVGAVDYFELGERIAKIEGKSEYNWFEVIKKSRDIFKDILGQFDHMNEVAGKEI